MRRVALINPPYFPKFSRSQRSPGVIKSGALYYPYWLAHAAAVLEAARFEVDLIDCPAEGLPLEGLLDRLSRFQPALCFLETSTASGENDCRVAEAIKARLPGTVVCVGGTHATALWRETLEKFRNIDCVAIGEFDYVLRDLAESLSRNPPDYATIPALGFRKLDGQVSRGPLRPPIENVDELPWIAPVYRRFLKPTHYRFSLAQHPMVMLLGGRGCVARCSYCVYPQVMHGHRYRTRSPASIVGEMLWVQENMPEVKEIVFEDDTFTGDRQFARDVAALVRERGVRLPWFANIRTNIDYRTLADLRAAGLRCCAVGFESGDDLLLKNMQKGQTVEQQKALVENCRKLGILVHGCFMVGFPGETRESMMNTYRRALELGPDSVQFYPVMPFPGTAYYRWAKKQGYLATERYPEWLNEEGGHRCVLNLPGLPPNELERFCEDAIRRFHFRPRYLFYKLRQAVASPCEGLRSIRSFLFYLIYLATNQRKKMERLKATLLPVPLDWRQPISPLRGRMGEQARVLRDATAEAGTADLAALAKKYPDL